MDRIEIAKNILNVAQKKSFLDEGLLDEFMKYITDSEEFCNRYINELLDELSPTQKSIIKAHTLSDQEVSDLLANLDNCDTEAKILAYISSMIRTQLGIIRSLSKSGLEIGDLISDGMVLLQTVRLFDET